MRRIAPLVLPSVLALVATTLHAAPKPSAHGGAPAAPVYSTVARWPVAGAGGWDYLTLDAAARRLYVTRGDHVAVLDADTGELRGQVAPTDGVHGVALATGTARGYASNGRSDSVTVFDTGTLATVATIAIEGHNPDAILYDDASAHVFTFNGKSHDATVIDTKTDKPIATIALGGKPEFAASDGKGRVFVNIEDRGELAVIDAKTNAVVATWPLEGCEEPTGLAFDRAHARLFSVCQNGKLVVTDSASGKRVATVPIGEGPDAAAFDADRQLVFSSNGEDGTLTVIHEDAPDSYRIVATAKTQPSARTMAYDAKSGRAFLSAAEFLPRSDADVAAKKRPTQKPDSFVVLVVAPDATAAKTP